MTDTTPSQTVGPFLTIGMDWLCTRPIARADLPGERIVVRGTLLDGDAKPVGDGLIETWQADLEGRFPHPEDPRHREVPAGFHGFMRARTRDDGTFSFTTMKPGRVPGPGATRQAPFLLVSVFARGMLKQAVTRMYFPGEPANADDPVLALVEPARRATLVARAAGASGLEWNVVLQGTDETVFFDL